MCNVDLPAVVNLIRRREVLLVVGRRLEDALERRHGCDRHLDEIHQDCYAAKEGLMIRRRVGERGKVRKAIARCTMQLSVFRAQH